MFNVVKSRTNSKTFWYFVSREFDTRDFLLPGDVVLFGPKTENVVKAFADGYIAGRQSMCGVYVGI